MGNFFIKRLKNEDGAVLITSLLFLMIVTVLAIIGIQSPKTDIMISGNEKQLTQSQQLATIGVMEAKNWLALHYKADAIPLNASAVIDGDTEYFIVARPSKMAKKADGSDDLANNIDTNFSRAGLLSRNPITTLNVSDTFNTPPTGTESSTVVFSKTTSSSDDYTLKNSNGDEVATYEWNIVRLTDSVGAIFASTEVDVGTYVNGLAGVVGSFDKPKQIVNGENVALDDGGAFWLYFYISSESESNGLISQSEGIASYKQIIPAK